MPSPEQNLIEVKPSRGITRPPAPKTPGLPFEAPSKKIAAEDELDQKELKAPMSPRNLHGGDKTGFKLIFPTTFEEEPKQIKYGKEDAEWPIISANHDNVFMTTS